MRRLSASIICCLSLGMFMPGYAEDNSALPVLPEPAAAQMGQPTEPADVPTNNVSQTEPVRGKDSGAGEFAENVGTKAKVDGSALKDFCAHFPQRLLAFSTGFVVGTPIAWMRSTKREIVAATRDLAGDTENPAILAPCAVLGVPAGIIGGAFYGVLNGMADSLVNVNDAPYSKEAFSLGELKM